jgi:hypothetical protein
MAALLPVLQKHGMGHLKTHAQVVPERLSSKTLRMALPRPGAQGFVSRFKLEDLLSFTAFEGVRVAL